MTSRNKVLMHQAHGRAGAPHAEFRYAPTLAEGLVAAESLGYPVVIKPALGAASNFVFRADSPAEFERCYDDAAAGAKTMKWARLEADDIDLGPDGLVVESFLDGSEHLIEAVAWDGEVCLASVVDRVGPDQVSPDQVSTDQVSTDQVSTDRIGTGQASFDYNLHWAPTTLTDDQLSLTHAALTAAARGHGLRRSVLHAEVRFHQGQPHVLEITPRPGGGGLEHMARASAGYYPIAAHVQVACGRRPDVAGYQPTGIFTAARPLTCAPGTITRIVIPDEVTASPELLFCRLAAAPGDVIKRPPDGNDILGFLGATGASHDDAMNAAARLASMICVTVVN